MIVVYDVTSGESFANVKRWLNEIDQNCDVVNRVLGNISASNQYFWLVLFVFNVRVYCEPLLSYKIY